MPRVVRAHKEALTKTDIQYILNACSDIKLKTYVLLLAATGCRASEALSIRSRDINFETNPNPNSNSNPATAFIRGEYTKTKTDRTIMLTDELVQQLKLWLDYKQRTRSIGHYDKDNRKTYHEERTPILDKDMLIFSEKRAHSTKTTEEDMINGLYNTMLEKFEQLLDRLGDKYAEFEPTKKRRKITYHSIRRMVKSVISDLGLEQYSEIYIGHHSKSTYYRISRADEIKLFRKVEPYLTYMDTHSLEVKQQDLTTQIESIQNENRELRKTFTG